ncbi:MAG: hypothetical protein LQ345_002399 [Seirophora villosa]|nr:MAG: hypothetical protein LQ345_002399 [Seirophora villosa]
MRAIPRFSEAIAIQEKVLEEMQRDGVDITAESEIPLANGLNNLGCCYLHLSRYDEAESILLESLKIREREKWRNDEAMSYEFAESWKNIAAVRAAQGDFDEALRLSLTRSSSARYLLSLVLEAEGKDSEATRSKEQAESVLHELTKSHAASEIGIVMKAYDSLVTVWNGRSFISIPRVKKEDDL